MNDPWAGPVAEPPKITAHQVGRIVRLIEDYTSDQAADLISALARRHSTPGKCPACGRTDRAHSSTCPTQGDRS
jgi:hypothetical protein